MEGAKPLPSQFEILSQVVKALKRKGVSLQPGFRAGLTLRELHDASSKAGGVGGTENFLQGSLQNVAEGGFDDRTRE